MKKLKKVILTVLASALIIALLGFSASATIVMTQQPKEDISDATHIISKYSASFADFYYNILYLDSTSESIVNPSVIDITPIKATNRITVTNNSFTSYSTGQIGVGNDLNVKITLSYVTDTVSASDRILIRFLKDNVIAKSQSYDLIEIGQSGSISFEYNEKISDPSGFYFKYIIIGYGNYISFKLSDIVITEIDSESIGQIQKKTSEDVSDIKSEVEGIKGSSGDQPVNPPDDVDDASDLADDVDEVIGDIQDLEDDVDGLIEELPDPSTGLGSLDSEINQIMTDSNFIGALAWWGNRITSVYNFSPIKQLVNFGMIILGSCVVLGMGGRIRVRFKVD